MRLPAASASSCALIGVLAWLTLRQEAAPPGPAVESETMLLSGTARCAECHADVTDDFQQAPHSRTLQRSDSAEVRGAFAGRSYRHEATGVDYHYAERDGRLFLETSAYPRPVPIEWVFGSGAHARTPLITFDDGDGRIAGIEHVISWYADGTLGLTLGQDESGAEFGSHALGRQWAAAETFNCFGCHSTHIPIEQGRIDLDGIAAGIGCARCHWDSAQHADDMEQGRDTSIERFSSLSARESVDRCGECHRRADEMGGPIDESDRTIARFAPVGLVQSACFLRQSEVLWKSGAPARLDCTTCHDPHRPAERDWRLHAAVCTDCHDAAQGRASDCRAAARDANCIDCHMPKVAMNEHLSFTDHWIRVHRESEETVPHP
jgi:hypothetical protein